MVRLFIITAATLCWIFLNSVDTTSAAMASEDIVALLAIIILPLAIIFAALVAFEKITGFTIISSVEWIGKNTLDIIAWFIRNIKQALDLETTQSNHRVTARKKSRVKTQAQTQSQVDVRDALLDNDAEKSKAKTTEPVFSDFNQTDTAQNEAVFGFSATEAAIETEVIVSSKVVGSDTDINEVEVKQPEVGISLDISSLVTDTDVQSAEQPVDDTFNEYETELKTFFPEQEERLENTSAEHPVDAEALGTEELRDTTK